MHPLIADILSVSGGVGLVVGAGVGFSCDGEGRRVLENTSLGATLGLVAGTIIGFFVYDGMIIVGGLWMKRVRDATYALLMGTTLALAGSAVLGAVNASEPLFLVLSSVVTAGVVVRIVPLAVAVRGELRAPDREKRPAKRQRTKVHELLLGDATERSYLRLSRDFELAIVYRRRRFALLFALLVVVASVIAVVVTVSRTNLTDVLVSLSVIVSAVTFAAFQTGRWYGQRHKSEESDRKGDKRER